MSSIPRISPCTRLSAALSAPSTLGASLVAGAAIATGCAMPVVAAVGIGVWALCKGGKKWVAGGDHLKPATFIAIEHLTGGLQLHGGIMDLSLPPVIVSLKKLEGPGYAKAVASLENMMLYLNHFNYTGFGNGGLIDYQQRVIQSLQPGERTALPCSWFAPTAGISHIMVLGIECTAPGQYRVSVYNGGDGAENHPRNNDEDFFKVHPYILEDVAMENLLPLIPQLVKLHSFRPGNSSDKLYLELLPALGGKKREHSPEEVSSYFYGQTADSCSGYSIHLFLRSVLSEQEYYEFEKQFCRDSIQELRAGLINRMRVWEQTPAHAIVLQALEGRLQLLESTGVPQNSHKVTFRYDPLLSKSSWLGRMAYRSQRLFWDLIFLRFSPSEDMDSRIRGLYLRGAYLSGERDFDILVTMTEGGKVDELSRKMIMKEAATNGDNRLFTFLFHSGPINKENRKAILVCAIKLGNQEIIDALEDRMTYLESDQYEEAWAGAIKHRNFSLMKKLSLSAPIHSDCLISEFKKTVADGDHELMQEILHLRPEYWRMSS